LHAHAHTILNAVLTSLSLLSLSSNLQSPIAEEITNLVRPAQKDHDRVVDWFKERGATNVVSFGDALEMEASVGKFLT
jgi:hypothetical protein